VREVISTAKPIAVRRPLVDGQGFLKGLEESGVKKNEDAAVKNCALSEATRHQNKTHIHKSKRVASLRSLGSSFVF
jgi:hypothetical protein